MDDETTELKMVMNGKEVSFFLEQMGYSPPTKGTVALRMRDANGVSWWVVGVKSNGTMFRYGSISASSGLKLQPDTGQVLFVKDY